LVQNEEKFNDKAERALLNEVLKLVEAIRVKAGTATCKYLSRPQVGR